MAGDTFFCHTLYMITKATYIMTVFYQITCHHVQYDSCVLDENKRNREI